LLLPEALGQSSRWCVVVLRERNMKTLLRNCLPMIAILATAGIAHSQEAPTKAPAADVAALFAEADASMVQHDYAAAAQTYQQLLAQLPFRIKAHQAAFKAALCFDVLEQPANSVAMYDRVVAIGNDLLKPRYYK